MKLQNALAGAIRDFGMFPRPGMKVAVGLSGGADSVALVLSLAVLEENRPEIVACHFNHMLRGDESERDADFVSGLCERHSIRLEVRATDTAAFSKDNRLSIEQGARELRYRFFRELNADRIATAHTMDDRAETVLMRILRGSGSLGISSIKPVSGNLIRPFFAVSRADVLEYLRARGEKWIEDSSNASDAFTRNRVRNRLIPLLETFNPRIKSALNRLADTAGAEHSFISTEAERAFSQVFTLCDGDSLMGPVAPLCSLHKAVRAEVLRSAYARIRGGLERLEFKHVEEMEELLAGGGSGAVTLPCGVRMDMGHGVLRLSRGLRARDYEITVSGEGTRELSEGVIASFEKTSDASMWGRPDVGHFSLEKTRFPIEVRNFRSGDRTVPLGMEGTKKLKSVFVDKKVPSFLRDRLPLFLCNGRIIWAGGVVVSELHKAEKGRRHLRIRLSGDVMDLLEKTRSN